MDFSIEVRTLEGVSAVFDIENGHRREILCPSEFQEIFNDSQVNKCKSSIFKLDWQLSLYYYHRLQMDVIALCRHLWWFYVSNYAIRSYW